MKELEEIRRLKKTLATLAATILGQHLWSICVGIAPEYQPTVCLCKCCSMARQAYKDATGIWPTVAQHQEFLKQWVKVGEPE